MFVFYFQAKECVNNFFDHCTRPFAGLIQICGHNKARQRDKLAHLMEDFSALQDEVNFSTYNFSVIL
jgi:hypothetical protein